MSVLEQFKSNPTEWAEPAWEIATLFPPQGQWAEADYLSLQTNHLIEFSHGIVEVLSMPSDKHQSIVAMLFTLLLGLANQTGGKALFAPFRLRLWPGKFREPDLVFLANRRDPRRLEEYWSGADLVMEVISPDDPNRDLIEKRREYAQAGIAEYWIVDPRTETVLVLQLAQDVYQEVGRFGRGGTASSPTYPALGVEVNALFDVG